MAGSSKNACHYTMAIIILILAGLVLLLAPFRMNSTKYFPLLVGLLTFAVVFFLQYYMRVRPNNKLGNFVLLTGIIAAAVAAYMWYFRKIIGRGGNNSNRPG